MSIKVQALGLEGTRATTLASNGKDRLKELRRQLDAARTNCAPRDRPLCETIDTSSLDIIIRFETVLALSKYYSNNMFNLIKLLVKHENYNIKLKYYINI